MMAACPSWADVKEAMADCRPYLGKELTLLERLLEEDCKSTLYRVPRDKAAIA